MRLHPAPDLVDVSYPWYASRVRAMSFSKQFYTTENGWTVASQICFKWLATIKEELVTFKILKWKGAVS
jgi:hypothetical protein